MSKVDHVELAMSVYDVAGALSDADFANVIARVIAARCMLTQVNIASDSQRAVNTVAMIDQECVALDVYAVNAHATV